MWLAAGVVCLVEEEKTEVSHLRAIRLMKRNEWIATTEWISMRLWLGSRLGRRSDLGQGGRPLTSSSVSNDGQNSRSSSRSNDLPASKRARNTELV